MQNHVRKDWNWLASAGIDAQTQSKAKQLFKQYRVDGALLDFLASEEGLKLLAAHKAAARSTAPASEPDPSTPTKGSRQLRGRQKISPQERQGQGHYFDLSTPERNSKAQSSQPVVSNGNINRLRKVGSGLQDATKAGPCRPEEVVPGTWIDGCIKSFNEETGYGFIAVDACVGDGQDIFLHRKELPAKGGPPEPGRVCSFLLMMDKQGRQRACQIAWLHPDSEDVQSPGNPMEAKYNAEVKTPSSDIPSVKDTHLNGARFWGEIKSRGTSYGFISCDSELLSGQDIFVQKANLEQLGPGSGTVSFEVFFSSKCQPQAKNVRWEEAIEEACGTQGPTPDSSCETEAVGKVSRW